MSANTEDEKDSQKAVPLDLARNQVTSIRTVETKAPIVMSSQSLRSMRVLTQGVSSSNPTSIGGPTIITTNLVSQAVLKPDSSRPQLANIIPSNTSQPQVSNNLQKPTQITLAATPLGSQNTGTSYHVPRGPAVVANLAAPRSNVAAVRAPMVVTAQTTQPHTFVRPPRTPSPAQGTAWLTSTSNGSQIKGAPTVLSSPVRGATVTGKPQIVSRTQPQAVPTIRSGTILQSAITIGQSGQLHSFKPGTTGIQALGNAVTIAQVLPSRTQVVYSANSNTQFTPARITVASTLANQRPPQPRSVAQVTTARLTVPVNVATPARLVAPQATILTPGTRIATVSTPQPTVIGSAQARIVTTQPNVTLGRLSVAASPTTSTANLLGQTRISTLNLHSLVAVASNSPSRNVQTQQGAKVIAQSTPGTIHLTSLPTPIKTSASILTTSTRTISVPAAIVTQRQAAVVPSQAISIAKVSYPQSENQVTTGAATNLYIHTQMPPTVRRSPPSPITTTSISQTNSALSTNTVATYSLASGPYFYENSATNYSVNRSFNQQQTTFSPLPQTTQQQSQQPQQQIRPQISAQVHGIVTNQQLRFNPIMVTEQNRNQQSQQQQFVASHPEQQQSQEMIQQSQIPKITSSPRPSILRKEIMRGRH